MAIEMDTLRPSFGARAPEHVRSIPGVSSNAAQIPSFTPTGTALAPPADSASFSAEALEAVKARDGVSKDSASPETPNELSDTEQKEVEKLQQRDAEVRRHEQAHLAAAGRYARGGAQFEFSVGPDGRQYATGGEVSIDVSPESTPEATIAKAAIVRRAALAPGEPSSQDRQVAAQASQLELEARQRLSEERAKELQTDANERAPRSALASYQQSGGSPAAASLDLKA